MRDMLGVIGGMGPLASQLFYKMIIEKTAAEVDQDHINLLLLSDAEMPDRTGAILSGDIGPIYERLLEDARLLAESRCKGIAIPCNTSHYFADMLEPKLGIPIIHMIRETAAEVARTCKGQLVAVLATDGTVQTGLYQRALEREGVMPYIPSEKNQKRIMHLIYDCIKCGKPADMEAWNKVEEELLAAGCQKGILACTELSCIREQEKLSDYYVDAMEILAVRSIEFMGKKIR